MDKICKQPRNEENQPQKYSWGHGKEMTNRMGQRTAEIHAAFFLPHLEPGMKVLDCGCGPGSITTGIAQKVAPGETLGIDVEERLIEIAQVNTENLETTNLRFAVGSVYELTFADKYFDAVFSHALLEHINDPIKALKEMARVLRPGGVMGVRETDKSGRLLWPPLKELQKGWELTDRLVEHNGGDSGIGKRLRSMLCQVGLKDVEASASYDSHGRQETVDFWVNLVTSLRESEPIHQVVELGWSTQNEIDEIVAAYRQWAKDPGAFLAHAWCEAIGWKEHPYGK